MRKVIAVCSFVLCASLLGKAVFAQTKDRLPCIDKKFSVVVHVVKDSTMSGNGYGQFNPLLPNQFMPLIQTSIDSLNAHFAPICVSFEVCEYRYISNYWYLNLEPSLGVASSAIKFTELRTLNNQKNRINIYYVNSIDGGLTYFVQNDITNVNDGGIALTNKSVKNILIAMGLYFGLTTTFEPIPGELVDGSNAETTGDFLTDTPADPYVRGDDPFDYVNLACRFISMKKDANNQYYSPLVGNAMTFYLNQCLCNSPNAFTHQQYKKMAETYLANPGMW